MWLSNKINYLYHTENTPYCIDIYISKNGNDHPVLLNFNKIKDLQLY